MDAILRGAAIYLFLLLLFRLSGKRTLGEITTFDFVLLLLVSEATQQALLGEDFSITMACLVIATLIGLDVSMAYLKQKFAIIDKLIEGTPTILMKNGKVLQNRLDSNRVDVDDILQAARMKMGLSNLEEVDSAVLERDGGISIIPNRGKMRPT